MTDLYNRKIDYMRISVTDRCNLRCIYCMPANGVEWVEHSQILTFEEILTVCRAASKIGIKNFRLTGGEPLVRSGVVGLVRAIKTLPGVNCVTMTTNGQLFANLAGDLRKAGLDGVNISIDTLNRALYSRITRGGVLEPVLEAMEKALALDFSSVKINCVTGCGQNEDDLLELALLAKNRPVFVRYIETMPIGSARGLGSPSGESIKKMLEKNLGVLRRLDKKPGSGPAIYWQPEEFEGGIGFISAISDCFCPGCNRIRLTSTGFLKLCLNYDDGVDLKAPLRSGASPDEISQIIARAAANKPLRHSFGEENAKNTDMRQMSQIGG
jgi:cyclic pyranopterin phosphate synthase